MKKLLKDVLIIVGVGVGLYLLYHFVLWFIFTTPDWFWHKLAGETVVYIAK